MERSSATRRARRSTIAGAITTIAVLILASPYLAHLLEPTQGVIRAGAAVLLILLAVMVALVAGGAVQELVWRRSR